MSLEKGLFTQEDPIGLAGGLNAYGFASGDRINFSDPMGLCATASAAGSLACLLSDVVGAVSSAPAQIAAAFQSPENRQKAGFAANLAMVPFAFADVPGGAVLAASERLLGEAISGVGFSKSIAGAGSRVGLRDAERLVADYGGKIGDWAKMVGRSEKVGGQNLQVHWYENVATGFRTEFKHNLPPR